MAGNNGGGHNNPWPPAVIAAKVYVTETELKFQVPSDRRDAVAAALQRGRVQRLHLCAFYVDSPDRRLAAAGMALRLRRENRRWVQTLKGRGSGMFSRFEHEVLVPAPAAGQPPVIDLNRFAGTTAGEALADALGDDAPPLQVLFATDVRRTLRLIRSGASVIEVVLDEGTLRAGEAVWPLCEVEFELKSGCFEDLVSLASRWVQRFGLWLDVRTKADRGDQLARGLPHGPVVNAGSGTTVLARAVRIDAGLRQMVLACLAHLLPNAAELARGRYAAEHVHQCRVALRRLRSVLQVFSESDPALPPWQVSLKAIFDVLGGARDRHVRQSWLWPALQAAGTPATQLPAWPGNGADVGAVLRAPAVNLLWLDLIRYAHAAPDATSARLRPLAAERLRHQQRRLRKDAAAFATMDGAARHAVRKRLKRFRYSLELTAPLWSSKTLAPMLEALRPAQQVLGELNDLAVAQALFALRQQQDPGDWFARGWIAARTEAACEEAVRALSVLAHCRGGWRRHAHGT